MRSGFLSPQILQSCETTSFEVLEVGESRDRCFELRANGIFDFAGEGRNKFVPFADFLDERLHVSLVEVAAFVADFDLGQLRGLDEVENLDDAEMAPQEVLYAPKLRITGVLRLAERLPRPALTLCGDALAFDHDEGRVFAEAKVCSFAPLAGPC